MDFAPLNQFDLDRLIGADFGPDSYVNHEWGIASLFDGFDQVGGYSNKRPSFEPQPHLDIAFQPGLACDEFIDKLYNGVEKVEKTDNLDIPLATSPQYLSDSDVLYSNDICVETCTVEHSYCQPAPSPSIDSGNCSDSGRDSRGFSSPCEILLYSATEHVFHNIFLSLASLSDSNHQRTTSCSDQSEIFATSSDVAIDILETACIMEEILCGKEDRLQTKRSSRSSKNGVVLFESHLVYYSFYSGSPPSKRRKVNPRQNTLPFTIQDIDHIEELPKVI